MKLYKDLPMLEFKTYEQWLSWLEKNHVQNTGVWIMLAKKNTGVTTISYEEAREGALIYGWIDGLTHRYDEIYYLIRFTPRRPKGVWSKINHDIVEKLIKDGKMKPAGLAQIDAAKADGRWDAAYAGQSTITIPDDLQKALNKNPEAKKFFDNLDKANRYAFLYRIHTAHKLETRVSRIQKTIDMLNEGKIYHS